MGTEETIELHCKDELNPVTHGQQHGLPHILGTVDVLRNGESNGYRFEHTRHGIELMISILPSY